MFKGETIEDIEAMHLAAQYLIQHIPIYYNPEEEMHIHQLALELATLFGFVSYNDKPPYQPIQPNNAIKETINKITKRLVGHVNQMLGHRNFNPYFPESMSMARKGQEGLRMKLKGREGNETFCYYYKK
jgi:hypothetical protein